MTHRSLIPALLLVTSSIARAAEPISLVDAMTRAERSSPVLQKAESMRTQAHWQRVEAAATWLPTVSGSASYLLDKKYVFTDIKFNGAPASIPGIVPTSVFGLNANYVLFDGFASTNRWRAADRLESAARDEYEWTRFELRRTVAREYYRALAAKSLRAVAESNVGTLKDHLSDTREMRRSGLSTNYDVLRVEVQVSEADSELMNATDNIELSAGKLAEALGLDAEVDPVGKMPELRAELVSNVGREPSGERPDLRALARRNEGLDLRERAGARHWVPQVSLFGNYTYYNNLNDRFTDWDRFRNAYQLGLSLTWNLFDGFRSTATAHDLAERHVQAAKTLRTSVLKSRQDLNFWTRKFKYYCSVYKSRQSDITKATESVRLAREGRRAGARTNTDLLDAESDLFRAQAGAISAQLGTIEALINVELAVGQPLMDL